MWAEIRTNLRRKYKTTAFAAGIVSALAFAPLYVIPALFLGLATVFYLTDNAQSAKQAAGIGYSYGFGFFMAGFYWIGNALLVDIAAFGWLYPITLFLCGGFFGLFMILPFVFWYRQSRNWKKVLAFAAVWVLMEWLRSFVLTGFPWNLLGTVLSFHPAFIQTAALWGTYGLSFLVLLSAGSLYISGRQKQWRVWLVNLLAFGLLWGYGVNRLAHYDRQESDILVRLVQPSIPQEMKWDKNKLESNFQEYIAMSRRQSLDNVDFVVWGETATPFDLDYYPDYRQALRDAVPPQGYLITGLVRFDIRQGVYQPFNSMYVLDKNGQRAAYYDKSHLVPFGEYIPLREYLPEWIRPVTNNIAAFGTGEKYKNIEVGNYPAFGALICYEIIFPGEVVHRTAPPSWLVVLTNDGWYGRSAGPYQHLAATQMRAVEEGITIVRSANSGISAVINPVGEIIARIDLYEKNTTDTYLPLNLKLSTPYSRYGNNIIISIMLMILAFLQISVRLSGISRQKNS